MAVPRPPERPHFVLAGGHHLVAFGPHGRSGEFATLLPPDGDAYLRVQWTGSVAPGCHLALHVDAVEDAVEEARELGASAPGTNATANLGLTSPGSLSCCVVGGGGHAHRPAPTAWDWGGYSLVDQVCLDIPAYAHERECAFWSAMTGWSRRRGPRPEFEYLERAGGMPLRLLLQRLDDGGGGPCRAQLDLACDDVSAECERHGQLGATVVRAMPNWTTLPDPAGLHYCVTRRDPLTGTLPALPP